MEADVIVIGGGTVGAAVAYGLAKRRLHVLMLDGADRDYRAATANFGLVWQQGKGIDMPAYQLLTRASVERWHEFSHELSDATGIDLQYEKNGGLTICLGDAEFEARHLDQMRLHNQLECKDPQWEMLDRAQLEKVLRGIELGREVTGAGFGHSDGHVNPLRLLSALHLGFERFGGKFWGGVQVNSIEALTQGGYAVRLAGMQVTAARVVIAAGLGSKALGAQVGLDVPIKPQRGQIIVTERVEPFLPLPMSGLRQTREGTVMIGATHDDVGFDNSVSSEGAAAISTKAIRRIPGLGRLTVARHWAGLRILTPDGYPIYAESESHPGVFIATCHSGVTLAAVHADLLADGIAVGHLPPAFAPFHQGRFNVP